MTKPKDTPLPVGTREERIAQRMAERLRASREQEAAYEATLDPRQKPMPAICQGSGHTMQN